MSGGGGGGGDTTTVQKADPWEGVQPYLMQAYGQLAGLYGPGQNGPQYFPGQTVAAQDPLEQAGINTQLGNLQQMQNAAGTGYWNNYNMSNNANSAINQGQNLINQGASGMAQQAAAAGQGSGNTQAAINGLFNQSGQMMYGGLGADQALNSLLGYGANNTQTGYGGAVNAMNQLTAAGDPANNPYFQSAVQSAIRPVTEQFQEQVLPGIKQGAQAAGQMGGSRQGIAEGIAARGYQNTIGDIATNMGNAAYAQGLGALSNAGSLGSNLAQMGLGATQAAGGLGTNMAGQVGNNLANIGQMGQGQSNLAAQLNTGLAGLGSGLFQGGQQNLGQATALTPTVQQSQTYPGQLMQQLGQGQTAYNQDVLNSQVDRYNYQQNLPYTMIADYLSLLNGAQGGQTTASQQGGNSRSPLMGALGGAAAGASLGSAFPVVGTGLGAGAGALLGLFM